MPLFPLKKHHSGDSGLPCTWSSHVPQSGSSSSPLPRSHHTLTATATAAGDLFLFGGYVNGHASSDLYVFSTRDFSTTLLQASGEIPSPRGAHSSALIGTTLLIHGGRPDFLGDHVVPNHDSLYLFDLESQVWTRVVNGPRSGGHCHHTTTVVGSKLFVFGGQIGHRVINDIWTLDLDSIRSQPHWEPYEPTPGNKRPPPRNAHVSVTIEDRIIIFGGKGDQDRYNDTWSFDILTREWTELQCTGTIPSPRSSHAAVLVDDVMYVFGGCTGRTYFDDLYALQLSTRRWFKFDNVEPSPRKSSAHAMASDGTRVFVVGGYSKGSQSDETSLIHVFDTKYIKFPDPDRTWIYKGSLDQPPHRNSSSSGSSEAHDASSLQNMAPAVPGRSASLQITHERNAGPNGQPLELTGVNSTPRRVPEGDVSESSTEYHAKTAAPHSSSEGVIIKLARRLDLEWRRRSASLAAQTEWDQRIARQTDELTLLKSTLLEQAEANAAETVNRLLMQVEEELTNVYAMLEAKEFELEEVQFRLTAAENVLTESKAEADTIRAQTASGSANTDEDQATRRLIKHLRVDPEVAPSWWKEEDIEVHCPRSDPVQV